MDLVQFVPESLIILVVSLYVLGVFFKKSKVSDRYIPSLLLAIAIISSCLLTQDFSITPILQGVICWGVAVGINQAFIVQPKK